MRGARDAFGIIILCIVSQAFAQQRHADRESVQNQCVWHFTAEHQLPPSPLAALHRASALAQDLCACAADRVTSNDRLSQSIAKVQAAPETDMAPVEMTLMLGALLFCSGEALERHGELQRSPPTMAAWDMARAAIVPGPAAPPPDATRPRTRSCPKPDYPPLARREGAEGATRLAFLITERGAYSKVHIVRSSGDTPAHKLLDFTAVAALADCRWEPSKRNGEAQKAWAFIEFVWTLR